MTDPRTVGDLDPDREVLRVRSGGKVHLPDADCQEATHRETRRLRAGVLFDDVGVCRYCRGVADCGETGECHLPTTTEVPSDD